MRNFAEPTRGAAAVAALALLLALAPVARATSDPVAEIRSLLARSGPAAGAYGVVIADAADGRTLLEVAPAASLVPASTMKVVTSSAALLALGPEYRFRTELRAAARPDGAGVLRGDLVARGGGDPTLSAAPEPGAAGRIEELAAALAKAGVKRIEGDLVLDGSFFDEETRSPHWDRRDFGESWCPPITALTAERAAPLIRVTPGAAPGAPGAVAFVPPTGVLDLVNEITTTADKSEHRIVFLRPGSGNRIVVRGRIWDRSPKFEDRVAAPDPAALFGDLLHRALVREGIALSGEVVARRGAAEGTAVLASIETALPAVIRTMNTESDNLYAECLLKTLGREVEGEGSFAGGARAAAKTLAAAGLPVAELAQVDGSGLARANRVSPRFLAALLVKMYGPETRLMFLESLATGGDGTLSRRLKDLGGDVRAKTGTITGVSALAGYVRAKSGRILAFAILDNDPKLSAAAGRELQDAICRILREGC